MAKYKVLKKFRDTHTKEVYEEGQEIDMLVKRADEVEKNLDDTFLKRLDLPPSQQEDNNEEEQEEKEDNNEEDE